MTETEEIRGQRVSRSLAEEKQALKFLGEAPSEKVEGSAVVRCCSRGASTGRGDRVRICADRTAFNQDHEVRLQEGDMQDTYIFFTSKPRAL